jgi:hypothetical protein
VTRKKPSVSSWLDVAPAALLGGFAVGGAAAAPAGVFIGWPGWAVVVAIAAAAVALGLALAPPAAASRVPAAVGLMAPVLLLCMGVPLGGVRALSGPPLAALALAGAVLALARTRWRPPAVLFLPLAFAELVVAAGRSHVEVGPEGDEPHYLMVADSLLRDSDVSLERDYAEARYAAFHDAPLAPHFRVRGRGGEVYSLHAVGLSVLILPAWALAGYAGVTVFMAFVAALVAREVREWARELTGSEPLADAAGWLAALSPPLVHYAGLVFTEVPAALALSFGLRLARRDRLTATRALAIGVAAALLPWLNVRYAPLAVVVVAHALYRHRHARPAAAVLGPCVASAAGLLLYHHHLYGFWDPRRVYGRRPEFSLATLAEGLPGLLLDQEFGLLVYAPVLALAIPGFAWLVRRDRALGFAAATATAAVVLTAGTWHMWRGGFNPPGRFLVPIAPLLLVAVALVWERRGLTAGASLLVGWTLWTGLAGAWEPRLVHRDRDETAPFFRERSGAREWTALLPGYVLSEPDRQRLAALWAVALVAAVPWRRRAPSAARLAAASLGLVAAAQVATALTHQRTEDRDAVRLVGRPALHVPGFRAEVAEGAWSPDALGWGPLYEPHRHPAGAEVGRRLALPPGSYALSVEAEGLHGSPPSLRVLPDRPEAPVRRSELVSTASGWKASFTVRPGERAVNLLLVGGGPLLVRRLTLRLQPDAPGPV